MMRVFGPVPSRRLGRSIGINNIPPKICTYSCVYCQLGRSLDVIVERRDFHPPQDLLEEIEEHVRSARDHGESIDYLTVVPDGEPTLDANLGTLLELLRPLDIPLAVITNATLIDQAGVRKDLARADWVSLKVDTVDEEVWRRIDRPHRSLHLPSILEGMRSFASAFSGRLITETMLVAGINDGADPLSRTAAFLRSLRPDTSYLSVPTRPPAEKWVTAPDEEHLNRAWQIFDAHGLSVEYLNAYEGNRFAYTGDVEEGILGITSVHPMREDAVRAYLEKAGSGMELIEGLVQEGKLVTLEYDGRTFYLRKLTRHRPPSPSDSSD